MKRLAVLAFALLVGVPAPFALARPITLMQLKGELASRDVDSLKVAYLDGHPVLSGEMLDQGFEATLRDCTGPEKACEAIRFVSCYEMPEHSRIEALEVANAYNMDVKSGVAYAEEQWFGQTVCLKLLQSFRGDEAFGLKQVFEWQMALEDFVQGMEDARTSRLATNVLDIGQQ